MAFGEVRQRRPPVSLGQPAAAEQRDGSRVLEHVVVLGEPVAGVQPHEDRAELGRAEEHCHLLPARRRQHGHPVALAHAGPLQRRGAAQHQLAQLGIGEHARVPAQRVVARVRARLDVEQLGERARRR